jgi:hypothetical protein
MYISCSNVSAYTAVSIFGMNEAEVDRKEPVECYSIGTGHVFTNED